MTHSEMSQNNGIRSTNQRRVTTSKSTNTMNRNGYNSNHNESRNTNMGGLVAEPDMDGKKMRLE